MGTQRTVADTANAGPGGRMDPWSILASIALTLGVARARACPPERERQASRERSAAVEPAVAPPTGVVGKVDEFQRKTPGLSFLAAVWKKYGDDAGGKLVSQLTYAAFVSLFPLLLLATTVLGYVLANNPSLRDNILNSALAQFPIIGDQLRQNVNSLHGSGLALAIGIAGAMWGGLGVSQAAQDILATVWGVPMRSRPNFVRRLLKAAAMFVVLAAGLLTTTALSVGASSLADLGRWGTLGVAVASVFVNMVWFAVAFMILSPAPVRWRQVWPGSLVAAAGWQILFMLGSWIVDRQLRGATASYGFFGVVLGLLAWISLLSTILVLSAEVNAVRAFKLWPRSVTTPGLTPTDRRALATAAKVQERSPEERIDVRFDGRPKTGTPPGRQAA
jgi:YihY family inner membrane protein